MGTKFECCIPIITVNDMTTSKEFYVEKLGFKLSFEWGSPVSYVGLERDEVSIHLIASSTSRQQAGTGNICIITNEVDNYFSQCKQRGVETIIEPADREYGLRDFGLRI